MVRTYIQWDDNDVFFVKDSIRTHYPDSAPTSLIFLHNAVCLVGKLQIPVLIFRVIRPGLKLVSASLEASTRNHYTISDADAIWWLITDTFLLNLLHILTMTFGWFDINSKCMLIGRQGSRPNIKWNGECSVVPYRMTTSFDERSPICLYWVPKFLACRLSTI